MTDKLSKLPFIEIKNMLNDVSPSFCLAKWYNATIWLSNGRTASCHHPMAHQIPTAELANNPSALHNTTFKKAQRELMQLGLRPPECGYCWRIEDADDTQVSDRVFKSAFYTATDLEIARLLPSDVDVDPIMLEISFDNLCNLSCSYCNSEFSSKWASDIKLNGAYQNMKTSGGHTYRSAYDFEFDAKTEDNVYIEAFFQWWQDGLRESLGELRITGGEPTRSQHFWKFVDRCHDEKFLFAVNSNLQMNQKLLDRLIDCSTRFDKFHLYTSGEAHGKHAEFIRHGLQYDNWMSNLKEFADRGNYENISVMLTINALSLFSVTAFLDDIVKLKQDYGQRFFHLSANILRFPSFQSVNILPTEIKMERAAAIQDWLNINSQYLVRSEIATIERVASYLTNIDRSYEDTDTIEDKTNDFAEFYSQYAERRGIDFREVFGDAPEFIKWWDSIQPQKDT